MGSPYVIAVQHFSNATVYPRVVLSLPDVAVALAIPLGIEAWTTVGLDAIALSFLQDFAVDFSDGLGWWLTPVLILPVSFSVGFYGVGVAHQDGEAGGIGCLHVG